MGKTTFEDQLIAKCSCWEDFSKAMADLTKLQKGDCFERLTQLYLLTKPEYSTTLKHVWICKYDLPRAIRKKLALPNQDEGIDLVAETRTGEFWSIQSKFRTDNDRPLTYKDLSTFTNLTFNTCAGKFSQAVVVHTSNKRVKKRKLLGNTTEIGLQRWLEMTPEHWGLLRQHLRKKPARPKRRSPRPHQKKAIKAAAKHFVKDEHSRGKLIMPCGTGKSLTAFWIAEQLEAKTVLLVVPSLALIKQGVEDWTQEIVARNESPLPEWLCVCSDESAGKISTDEFVSETYDLGLPVTTDPQKIQQFLTKRTGNRRIVFVTYQSSPVFAKAARKAGVKFDLAVLDEAHKTAGEKSKAFATLLFDKNLQIKNRMFMTATERVMRGAHDEVVSMDEVKDYGECFYYLSFKEAIHSEPAIISNYKILTLFVTEDEIRSVINDKRFVTDRKHEIDITDSRQLAAAIALRKAYKKYRIKHAVSFHRSIQSASDFSDLHATLNQFSNLRPSVDCFHVSSKKTAGQRTQLLRDFAESGRSLITNARCLTEGVDVPAIDCVLFADPKQSTIDIVQAAGRSLRPYAGKECGYIMLPIIVPDGTAIDEFAESTEFRAVSRVITALSTQDERIAEEFRVVDRGKRNRGGIIQFDGTIPVGMDVDFREFADAISVKVWERAAKVNWRPFEEALAFARRLKLRSKNEWAAFAKSEKLPQDIPSDPVNAYGNKGWVNWGDWLGTHNVATFLRAYCSFSAARKFVRSLKLKSTGEWKEFTASGKLPPDIPSDPRNVYKDDGWNGMSDWLGNDFVGSHLRQFRSFEAARTYARKLGFERGTARKKWKELSKEKKLPKDIPADPYGVYKDNGWSNWPDFFGYAYRPFEEARLYARSLDLESGDEWARLFDEKKLPRDLPKTPRSTYRHDGWKGWPDFLDNHVTYPRNRNWRPFEKARKYIRSLKLGSQREWNDLRASGKLPEDIPRTPHEVYKNDGWIDLGDWLGTFRVASRNKKWRLFEQARKFTRSLKLKGADDWNKYKASGKLPKDIPASPHTVYEGKGWISVGDWLGTGRIANQRKAYRSFKQAREFARTLKLSARAAWVKYYKRKDFPEDIPKTPAGTYQDKGWKNWGDWLGTDYIANQLRSFQPFSQARKYIRSLKLKSRAEWREFGNSGKLPNDIPADPSKTYKDKGWAGYGDWLGTGRIANQSRVFLPFSEARNFARSLNLSGKSPWAKYCKRKDFPEDVPKNPPRRYSEEWISWGDWLGTGTIASYRKEYRPFDQARKFARSLKLKSRAEWKEFAKSRSLPADIPLEAARTYEGKGWISWGDWLGTGNVAPSLRKFRSFSEARKFARSLKLKSGAEWNEFAKSGKRPQGIPAAPNDKYKDKGWAGYPDWLGY